jgi:hypothetical protein
MTLCVAAQCVDNSKDKVVVAFEFSMESGIAQAEIEQRKLNWIGCEHFPVLMAGTHSRCRELIGHISQAWHERAGGVAFVACCREGIKRFKHMLANEYVGARLGMSYDDLLGKKRIAVPRAQYSELLTDIARMKLGGELLIVYFDGGESELVRIQDDGTLELCSNFAAIGSGMFIAESVFFQREYMRGNNLANSLYHVYEAMRLGAHGPGVGTTFIMGVVQFHSGMNDALWTFVEPGYLNLLEGEFQNFGPKPLKKQVIHRNFLRKLYLLKDMPLKAKKKKAPAATGDRNTQS